jgi:uncharacterized protein (DUF427 family)
MTLTMSHGPLSGHPAPSNYEIDGAAHRLFFDDFPRRVRARLGTETVLDTRRGKLLHETGLLPQLYVPAEDIRAELLTRTEHGTHCPFKGDASYWSIAAGGAEAENAVWGYEHPLEQSAWLDGYRAVHWESMDSWLDEDEEVTGHLRDPYHRVDVRHTHARVRVLAGADVVADTERVELLSETGLPNRFYLPRVDVTAQLTGPTDTSSVCPYKGVASYWTLDTADGPLVDAAWSYPDPLAPASQVRDRLCFLHSALSLEVDGEQQ